MMLKIIIALVCSLSISVCFADATITADAQSPTILHDAYGADINYPCSAGGELLVVYGTDAGNAKIISSKDTIYPLYVKDGFTASPLNINKDEQSDLVSFKKLIVQTTNPAYGSIGFDLKRIDAQPFYVNSVNYPSLALPSEDEGTLYKYVSVYRAFANDDFQTPIRATFKPVPEYWYLQDTGMFIAESVNKIQVQEATWNQNGTWTDGALGRHVYPIRYRFTPEKTPGAEAKNYNGYGFWVCGGEPKVNALSHSALAIYHDKMAG